MKRIKDRKQSKPEQFTCSFGHAALVEDVAILACEIERLCGPSHAAAMYEASTSTKALAELRDILHGKLCELRSDRRERWITGTLLVLGILLYIARPLILALIELAH